MAGKAGLAERVPARLSLRELRRFGFTIAIPMAVLSGIGIWRQYVVLSVLLGAAAAILVGFGLFAPGLLRPAHRSWMAGTHALSSFNTRLLLGLIYFLVMTPTGMIMRLVGRDPLNRQLRDADSYWVPHRRPRDVKSAMERMF